MIKTAGPEPEPIGSAEIDAHTLSGFLHAAARKLSTKFA
jgi:hypothetical protein